MDYRIFNVRTYVNARDCTRGCVDTRKRVCTESWLWEKKIPRRTGESNLRQRRDGPMLYPTELHPHIDTRTESQGVGKLGTVSVFDINHNIPATRRWAREDRLRRAVFWAAGFEGDPSEGADWPENVPENISICKFLSIFMRQKCFFFWWFVCFGFELLTAQPYLFAPCQKDWFMTSKTLVPHTPVSFMTS